MYYQDYVNIYIGNMMRVKTQYNIFHIFVYINGFGSAFWFDQFKNNYVNIMKTSLDDYDFKEF